MIDFIKKEDKVLVVINKKVNESDVQQLLKEVNNDGVQIIKSVDLKKAVFEPSTFNSILTFDVLDSEDIIKLLNAIKPGGSIIINKLINNSKGNEAESLFSSDISSLRLSGFRYKECKVNSITSKWKIKGLLADDYQDDEVICQIVGERPSYELGSSVALSFAKKPQATNVWKLDDAVENDLIDEDDLLEADDFAKPDKSSLRVCGTTGKRKACKDCSCGLREELNALEANQTPTTVKSSCGSCYLGDAFRCASCPYLGMPAFKPGEKVVLANSQLADDK